MEQIDLDFSVPTSVTQEEIDRLVEFLRGRDWVKAAEIEASISISDRRIRAIAEASNGWILSGPGCPGYKALSPTTELREVDEAANRLESQGKRMIRRALAIRRRAHQLLR